MLFLKDESVNDRPETALVEAAMAGDVESFTELCRRYYGPMVAIAHSIISDRHLAEDVAQQVFATAAVKLTQLKQKERFGAWVGAICRNSARDMLARKDKVAEAIEEAEIPVRKGENEQVDAVRAALAELPDDAREIVFLRYYDGFSYEQISAVLGIGIQAINGRLRRAKKKIAEYMRRNGFGEVRI